MWDFLTHLFDTSGFPPRWQCGSWSDAHGYLHILADLGIWSAYVAIPIVLLYFAYRGTRVPFRYLFVLFGAFILSCGATHLMEAIIFWWPAYRLAGVIKAATAIISWSTVIALVPIVPRALRMKGPEEFERQIQRHTEPLKSEVFERRKNEELLREQRELLRITLASIGDGVIATDAGGNVTFLNPVAETLTGWTSAAAQGRPLTDVFRIFNEHSGAPLGSPAQHALDKGTIVGLANHTVLEAQDGTRRPIEDSAAPIRNTYGEVIGAVLVFRDASERRTLSSTRNRLAAIVENSDDAIIGLDLLGNITSWNLAAEKLFGYTSDEAIGNSIQGIVPPDRLSEFTESINRLTRGERVDHLDTVRVRKNGTRVDVSSRISPIRDDGGHVIGASKVSHDISSRKRAERELAFLAETTTALASLADYDRMLEKIARKCVPFFADYCVVDTINSNGRIEPTACAHVDPQLEQVLVEAAEKYPLDWDSPSVAARVLTRGEAELTPQVTAEQIEPVVRDERHRQLLAMLDPRSSLTVPIVIHDRAVAAMQFVTSSSGRHYDRADLALANELARRAAIAIENARLYRELKEAQRQKDDFLAMLAHELRNPLAAIQYANEMAKSGPSQDDVAAHVIDRQLKVLMHLIDDLLDVSRITRGKIQLKCEPIDAAALVGRAVAATRPVVEERRHELKVNLPDLPIPLNVDATRVEQILVNLLSNAAKYTPEGGQISVGAYVDGHNAVLEVADTGIGIPDEMLPRIFDLFTQVDKSLDRSQGGLGIGLTVVRRLAEMHGGSVSASSDGLGRGSRFVVRLPLASGENLPARINTTRRVEPTPLKILVVDDNVDMASTMARLLKRKGHTVAVAHEGHAALETAATFHPQIVLLDLGLPGIDGYQVAQQLRRETTLARVRLIALSGYGQEQDRKRAQAAGFDRHLVKPVEFEQLLAAIGDVQYESM